MAIIIGTSASDLLTGTGNADTLRGLAGNDSLFGLAGNDTLDGGLGIDMMRGGTGNDIYIVDKANDKAIEVAGAGIDLVRASVSFTLGNNLENLKLIGAAAINGAGNSLANVMTGNNAANLLSGLGGNDKLFGLGGNDRLNGGLGDDRLDGGLGNDIMTGGPGNDTYVVGSSLDRAIEGPGGGIDLVLASASFTLGNSVENLTLTGAAAIAGTGNSLANVIFGNDGANVLGGLQGNDGLTGGGGNDQLFGGAGVDTFNWNPGDGSDVVDGGADFDILTFNGSAAAEIFAASVDPSGHLVFTRNVGNIVMDLVHVETIDLNALGGADAVTVKDTTGTEVTAFNVNLGVNGAGDVAVDSVAVEGTGALDVIQAVALNGNVVVTGLHAQVNISNLEAANDTLTLRGLGGSDTISGSNNLAALTKLIIDGGDGSDIINGGNGADTLVGGDGNDTVDGNGGKDIAFLGNGNDTAIWDPGDGSDIIEGQAGFDTLLFNGAGGNEIFAASSNGGRLLFTRNVANIVMDVDDTEGLTVNALGGIDTVTINDLTPTDITNVNINLGVNGVIDTSADAVRINGTVGNDVIVVSGSAGNVTITYANANGAYTIAITNADPVLDTLTINTSGGDDVIDTRGLANSSIHLTINGGAGDDFIFGSAGDDTINGNDGDDIMFGGPGVDTFTGGTGTDTANGGAGNDINGGGIETFNQ